MTQSGWVNSPSIYAAFLDDSGSAHPEGNSEFFALGLAVVPATLVRSISDLWWQLVSRHLHLEPNDAHDIELKSSDLYKLLTLVSQGKTLPDDSPFSNLDSAEIKSLIDGAWNVIASPDNGMRYLGAVIHKLSNWSRFCKDDYATYRHLRQTRPSAKETKELGRTLQWRIQRDAFYWLTQRLHYLMVDLSGITVFIGDECAVNRNMYQVHGSITSGKGYYTSAPRIINNIVFGSSLYNPCLQIADWVAYALQGWARMNQWLTPRLGQMLPKFRGYPDHVQGRGIVLNPNDYQYPPLPVQKQK